MLHVDCRSLAWLSQYQAFIISFTPLTASELRQRTMSAPDPIPTTLYKILTPEEHVQIQDVLVIDPAWKGSSLDRKDGFIHLSTAPQVAFVANSFYRDHDELVLLSIPLETVKNGLKWEPPVHPGTITEDKQDQAKTSNDSQLFPHYYGELDTSAEDLKWEVVNKGENGFDEALSVLKW